MHTSIVMLRGGLFGQAESPRFWSPSPNGGNVRRHIFFEFVPLEAYLLTIPFTSLSISANSVCSCSRT